MATAAVCILEVILADLHEGQTIFDEVHHLLSRSGLHFAGVLAQVTGDAGEVVYLDAVYMRRA